MNSKNFRRWIIRVNEGESLKAEIWLKRLKLLYQEISAELKSIQGFCNEEKARLIRIQIALDGYSVVESRFR